MILESVEHGPLIWPTVEENGVIRTKKYAESIAAEKIQADYDMKATNHSSSHEKIIDFQMDDMIKEKLALKEKIKASLHCEFSMTDLEFGACAHMVGCNHSRTPVDTESKLGDAVCLYMHDPWEPYFSALKWILRAEAEYRGVANAVAKTCWIWNLLHELHTPLSSVTIVYCNNVSAMYLSSNLVQHQHTKHIEIDIHFVWDLVATRQVRVLHVPSRFQYADIFTKGLPLALFDEFRDSLSVRFTPASTAREY
nr:NBS-containing resistance-like protein [Tanacetum cinerariifolium]